MEFFKIIGIALITLFLTLFVKQIKPEISIYISLTGGILIFFSIFEGLYITIEEFKNIISLLNVDNNIFKTLLKIIGIGYLTEFTASLCKDSQNSLLADKIIFAGKIVIFTISIPIFRSIIEIVIGLI